MTRIAKRLVDATIPAAKDVYVWDDDLPGFGLKVTPNGRKVYLVQYRLGGRKGRTRRYTIGAHGAVTPEQARSEAKRLLGEVSAGRDPMEAKDRQRAAMDFKELLDRFLSEHVDAKLKASTAAEYRRAATLYALPKLRTKKVGDIQRADIARLHHSLQDKPYQANRTVALLSKFFNWCERYGYRPDGSNPCRHVEKFRERKRERFLSAEEMQRLGAALKEAETVGLADDKGNLWQPSPYFTAAIRLLVLTGARLSEILTLQWDHVEFERASLRLPDSKTGAKTVYLNAPALAVLNDLPRLKGNPYVICGEKPEAHLVNMQKPWRRVRKAAGLDDVRIHDLRHSFASVAASAGMSLPMIGGLLGHSQPATTARYAHLAANPLRAAAEVIGRDIDASW